MSSNSGFFTEWIGIRDTFDVEDHGDTTKHPSKWRVLGLELGDKDEGLTSRLVQVDWALVNSLLFLAFNNHLGLAIDDRNDRELLLGFRLLKTASSVPTSTLNLEPEYVRTVTRLLLGQLVGLPVHSLLHFSLNVELVEFDRISSGSDLLDGSQEGLRVVQPVDEGYIWLLGRILFPTVKLLKTLLDVV